MSRVFGQCDIALIKQAIDDDLTVLARNWPGSRHAWNRLIALEDEQAHDPILPARVREPGNGLGGRFEPEVQFYDSEGQFKERLASRISRYFHLTIHLSSIDMPVVIMERAMQRSTTLFYCGGESPFGAPKGWLGALALLAMALKNGGQNRAALEALDIRPGHSVLEIGCGPGMGIRGALRRTGRGGFVAGVDRSPCATHFAAHAVHRAVFAGRAVTMRAEAADLPFRAAMFDRVFAVNSFQFWPDPARALREVERVLAPGGRLVVTQRASNPDYPTDFAGAASGLDRIDQATALLKQLGWRIIDERCVKDGARLMAASVVAERPA